MGALSNWGKAALENGRATGRKVLVAIQHLQMPTRGE